MTDIEEYGQYYLERRTISHPSGTTVEYFDVGVIIDVDDVRTYKPSSECGFKTREEARNWIKRQR